MPLYALLPDVLGNAESTVDESHSNGLLEHPQYTRPAKWMGHEIPGVLTSGNHAKVAEWRKEQSETLTQHRRPDLWEKRTQKKNKEFRHTYAMNFRGCSLDRLCDIL